MHRTDEGTEVLTTTKHIPGYAEACVRVFLKRYLAVRGLPSEAIREVPTSSLEKLVNGLGCEFKSGF
jgi:hypothetical protein